MDPAFRPSQAERIESGAAGRRTAARRLMAADGMTGVPPDPSVDRDDEDATGSREPAAEVQIAGRAQSAAVCAGRAFGESIAGGFMGSVFGYGQCGLASALLMLFFSSLLRRRLQFLNLLRVLHCGFSF